MLEKVRKFMEEYHMVEPGDGLVIGVSGGGDSMCLFHILFTLMKSMGLKLHVVHVNHMLRKEAEEEENYVRETCRKYGIPCTVIRRDVKAYAEEIGSSVEEAGRRCRYDSFEQIRQQEGYQKIAVAHHENDRVETMLFHMLRGTGMRGMGGIPPVRDRIIRPLLAVTRQEIEGYLKEHDIPYYTDASNFSDAYSRNRIRNQIIPLLEQENQCALSHMAEVADQAREYWDYVEKQAEKLEPLCVAPVAQGLELKKEAIEGQPRVVIRHILYRMLVRLTGSGKDLEQQHIEGLLSLLEKPQGKRLSLPYGIQGLRSREGLCLRQFSKDALPENPPFINCPVQLPGETLIEGIGRLQCRVVDRGPDMKISKKLYTKTLDYGKINDALCIRNPEQGDYFIVNEQGERKLLSRFFIDSKVPKEERNSVLVLAEGSKICWIIGMRISEDMKVSGTTEKVLRLEFQYEGE